MQQLIQLIDDNHDKLLTQLHLHFLGESDISLSCMALNLHASDYSMEFGLMCGITYVYTNLDDEFAVSSLVSKNSLLYKVLNTQNTIIQQEFAKLVIELSRELESNTAYSMRIWID